MTANRIAEEQATIQGLAELLAREQDKTPAQCWTEALSIYCTQFEKKILLPDNTQTAT
jgi:hypothetical protein